MLNFWGRRGCVTTGSGTWVLHTVVEAMGFGPGDEIITTPYTDMGTISAIISAHALPKSKKKWSRKTIFIWPIIQAGWVGINGLCSGRLLALLVWELMMREFFSCPANSSWSISWQPKQKPLINSWRWPRMAKYNLGTSANVIQLKKRLIELDIIDEMKGRIQFLDPMYKHWLATRYFTVR